MGAEACQNHACDVNMPHTHATRRQCASSYLIISARRGKIKHLPAAALDSPATRRHTAVPFSQQVRAREETGSGQNERAHGG